MGNDTNAHEEGEHLIRRSADGIANIELSSLDHSGSFDEEALPVVLPQPKTVNWEGHTVVLENKNISKNFKLVFQLLATFLSLLIIGLVDQVIGSVLDYILEHYQITRSRVSMLFLAQFCGYIPASILNSSLLKSQGVFRLYVSSCAMIVLACVFYINLAPFWMLIFVACGFGWANGTLDCILNYFVGTMDYSNQLLGLMHAMYGFGCLITPVFSNWLIMHGYKWNHYYWFIGSVAFTDLLLVLLFFRNETAAKYRYVEYLHRSTSHEEESTCDITEQETASTSDFSIKSDVDTSTKEESPSIFETLKSPVILLFSFLLFLYVGAELTVGVWLHNYLEHIQHQSAMSASISTTTFWIFMTSGRVILGFVTGLLWEDKEIKGMLLWYWMVTLGCFGFFIGGKLALNSPLPSPDANLIVNLQLISVCVIGFFSGPMFSTTIIISLKSLPSRYCLNGISLIAGFGGTGAAVVPSFMGYLSDKLGGEGNGLIYFPNMIGFVFGAAAIAWTCVWFKWRSVWETSGRLD